MPVPPVRLLGRDRDGVSGGLRRGQRDRDREHSLVVLGGDVFGVDPADPQGKDDIQIPNEIHIPLVKNPDGEFKPVIIYVSSRDVIHSFKVIAMRICQDAIPGMRVPIWFRPTRVGRYQINCAQLCGNGHSAMASGFITVESPEAYEKWLASKAGASTSFE